RSSPGRRPPRFAAGGTCQSRVRPQLDLVALDQRVREELLAHPLELGLRLGGVVRLELQLDEAADPRLADRESEVPKRALYSLTLRIEDARLGADEHGSSHRSTISGRPMYAENGVSVSCSNAST